MHCFWFLEYRGIAGCLQGDHLELLLQGLLGNHSLPSHGALMAISAGLFLPTTWLPDLGALSYVGALGVVSALGLTGTGPWMCSWLLYRGLDVAHAHCVGTGG